MKGILIAVFSFLFIASGSLVFSSSYEIVEIFICSSGTTTANLQAKATVSRKELYRASYCNCQGVSPDLMEIVKDNSCFKPGSKVEEKSKDGKVDKSKYDLSKDVYSCVCIGQGHY